jgi:hypothetical protein
MVVSSAGGEGVGEARGRPALVGMIRIVLLMLLAGTGLGYAGRSLWLAVHLERSLPYFDQWVFVVNDYFPYLDGAYSWLQLLAPHGEHRIATARIILFADAILFRMSGWLPLFVQLAALGTIALLLARLATRSRMELAIAAPVALGLMWSTSQFENLSWAFQTCFPLVHLFGLCAVIAFARALNAAGWRRWIVIACTFDVLAVLSLGSGLFVIAPVLGVAVWRRRVDRRLLVFALFHGLVTVAYLAGGAPISTFSHWAALSSTLPDQAALFLGTSFGGWPPPELAAGYCGLIALVIALGAVTADRQGIDSNSAILLSMAAFVMTESVVAAIGRGNMPIGPRYATAAIVFEGALLGFYFRQSAGLIARFGVVVIALVALVGANASRYEAAWIAKIAAIDQATAQFKSGNFEPAAVAFLWPELRKEWLDRYEKLQLGPFAP